MEYNLLVHYSADAGYFEAKKEVEQHLIALGDKKAIIDKLSNNCTIGVKTSLEVKEFIGELKELSFTNPDEFSATTKWVPVQEWCAAGLAAMSKTVRDIKDNIGVGERWGVDIETWGRSPSRDEIILGLKQVISNRFVEEHGSKLVFVEFVGDEAAISILKPNDVFVVIVVENE